MKRSLFAYFVTLFFLCTGFVVGARMKGEQGMYLAGVYMLTPAIAALITRLFFYKQRFMDAGLHFGRFRHYIKFWLYSLAITALSYVLYTLFGAIRWDFSGEIFLDLLGQQFAATGQNLTASLPPGFTPQTMLWLFFVGGLTIFNVMPGMISGLGEEFGHRGFMFPLLYPNRPWLGLLVGGFLWYLWHLPLLLVFPVSTPTPLWQTVINQIGAVIGSICTHTYLCYVYAKSKSIFVPSLAHITMNNAARSLSYFVVLQNQLAGNIAQYVAMVLVVIFLYYTNELKTVFDIPTKSSEQNNV